MTEQQRSCRKTLSLFTVLLEQKIQSQRQDMAFRYSENKRYLLLVHLELFAALPPYQLPIKDCPHKCFDNNRITEIRVFFIPAPGNQSMILSRNCSPSSTLRVSGSTLQQLQILLVHTFGGVQVNPCSQTGTFANNLYFMDLHCQASKDKSAGRHNQWKISVYEKHHSEINCGKEELG